MKKIVISANDMGMSKDINKKIIDAYQAGVLSHAALLPTGDAIDDALKLVKENRGLEVSAHLDLSYGKPLLASSWSLTDEDGSFLWSNGLNHTQRFTEEQYTAINLELRAQLDKLIDMGFKIVALSTHAGFAVNSNLFRIIINICNDYKLIVRDEMSIYKNLESLLRYGSMLSCEGLYGKEINLDKFDKTVRALFRKSNIIEIPFVPGYVSKDEMELDGVNEYEEMTPAHYVFSNLDKYFKTHDIKLTNYKNR